MEEIWKDIRGYEGLYQVSNWGKIRNKYDKILIDKRTRFGYLRIRLSKNGKSKQYFVHRLVAEAFIPNPNNYEQVNHKNELKYDNRVENLEWCDRKYNINYGTRNERGKMNHPYKTKKILQIDPNTEEIIKIYVSCKELFKETGFNTGYISLCCNGRKKVAYGFKWRYA